MMELSKSDRDMFLMGKLQVLIRDPCTVSHARSSKAVKKQRLTTAYMLLIAGIFAKKHFASFMILKSSLFVLSESTLLKLGLYLEYPVQRDAKPIMLTLLKLLKVL